jgi:hypothetical protein
MVNFPKLGHLHGKFYKNGLFAWYFYQKNIVFMENLYIW